ncbi:MAG: pectinesterase family protein [Janthinobacterium lividum]
MAAIATRTASWQGRATRFWVLLTALFLTCAARLYAYDVTVAKDGTGNYTTVQAAITAAPAARTTVYTIYIKDGIYSEKITVPNTKPFLQLVGQSVANTILTWNDNALTSNGTGGTVGTGGSGSIVVNATDFSALNITFVNSFGDGSQAVAVSLYADRAAFENCRFQGNQDTLLTFENGAVSRHYFRDCYIDGNVDFIFGNAIAIFDNCVIYAKTRVVNASTSYITAANTPATQTYGYLFRKAKIPSNNGTTLYYLGRPWQNSTGFTTAAGTLANNKVVFSRTKIGVNEIQPAGWVTWDTGTDVTKITFAEFQTKYFNGNNVNLSQRVSWSQQLTATDTLNYTLTKLFGLNTGTASSTSAAVTAAWDPATVATAFTTYHAPDIAVANLQATKGTTQTAIQWNASWAITGVQYDLQRSTDNVNFSLLNTRTATTDSLYNFSSTDVLPAAGTAYYYRVVASKAGMATHTTASIQVSSIPTITVNGAPNAFAQYATGTSATQTYTVSAANMTDNLTITPPANFEVSANGGTNWFTSASPLVLVPTSNTIASTNISVRLNATTAGTYSGNITHTSTGATTVNVAVTGTKTNTTPLTSNVLQWWPLKVSALDSANARSAGVTPSPQVLRRLLVSDGSTVSTITGYSSKFGQPVALTVGGAWSTAATPPAPATVGGGLDRRYYEQYTITAAAGHTLRLDSLIMTSAFYGTANGRMALVYSLTNFTTADSTNIPAGGKGPVGTLPTANNGAFATPIILNNQTSGPTNVYHFPLSTSTTGLTLTAGQTLTVRVYLGAGTSSSGRYALIKDVQYKGEDTTPVTCNAAFSYSGSAFCTTGTNPTATVTGTTGGTFSSTTGLTINASTGAVTLSSSTAGTYTVTYTASAGCTSTQSVTVTAPQMANIGYGAASYCTTTTGTVALGIGTGSTLGTVTVNPTTGLTIAANGTITPSTSTPGTYFITNTVAASGGCAAVTGGTTVTITAPATAGFSYQTATNCAGTATTLTPTMTAGATAGTFTLPATTGLTINATTGAITVGATAAVGTYTVTNTVAASGGCAATTSTASFVLSGPSTATFSYTGSPFCSNGTNPTPTITGTAGGTFSSATGLSINATTGVINLSASTAGTYTVTYTVAGTCGSSSTQSVSITKAATAGFTFPATTTCAGSAATLTPTMTTGATAGTFTLPTATGLSINATTGAVTVGATAAAGTYTITNTVAASGACAAVTSTATLTVTATPATPTIAISGTAATGITLTSSATTGNQFYLNGVLIAGATGQTYLVNSGTKNGSYTVVNSTGGCSSAASPVVTVVVTATANALAGTSLTLYPNPTHDGLLTLELNGYRDAIALSIVNTLGQRVFERTVSGNALTQKQLLDLSNLAPGVYMLQARTASGEMEVRRVVRN